MKTIFKTTLPFLFYFFSYLTLTAQCDQLQTLVVCSIENIDFDSDGTNDGIVNLYDQTGTTLADGVWSTAANISIALDATTGNLSTWELRESSENDDQYEFILSSATCDPDPVMTLNLILGPYSGIALPPDDDDINFYICDQTIIDLDLRTVLVANGEIPVAHINGVWSIVAGPAGGSAVVNGYFFTGGEVTYQPGLPRVDQEVYEIAYEVPGLSPCSPVSQTSIKVAVIRQVDAGIADDQYICESDIISGNWSGDLDIRDYLSEEDIEGYWTDSDNNGLNNFVLNIEDLYNQTVDNGNNERFQCQEYAFTYNVEKRSVVCEDRATTVRFVFYEQLRTFEQPSPESFCPVAQTINLFDLIEFQDGFVYKADDLTHWEFISGPSNLGLVQKRTTQPILLEELRCITDPAIFDSQLDPPYYSADGPIDITGAAPGEYRFRYYVCSDIVGCDGNVCPDYETEVVINILSRDYAGEDTQGPNFCLDAGSVDLRSLLDSNGIDTIVETGTWTDVNGDPVDNTFVFPAALNSSPQEFTFTYSTVSSDGCLDNATLSIFIYEPPEVLENVDVTLCSDDLTVTLFDQLSGNPVTTGIWNGPFGYESTDHLGVFDSSDPTLPILGPGNYIYTVPGNDGCTSVVASTVTIIIVEPVNIGNDRSESFCILDGRVNLFSLLDQDTPRTGVFQDIENTGALDPDSVVQFDLLPNPNNEINPIYNYLYVIPNALPCDESSLTVSIQIIDLPEPNVSDQEFCILDAIRLEDIEVDVLNYNWYDTFESEIPIVDNPILLDGQTFYIATVDADNCESERVTVSISILNTGEQFANGEFCTLDFQDGVSPDGNNQNDTFQLVRDDSEQSYNILEAFPDFALKIYNRYGTPVYEGNRNTEEFNGLSNVGLTMGDDLPSGIYFYVFEPNFRDNLPIQGSFYLSR